MFYIFQITCLFLVLFFGCSSEDPKPNLAPDDFQGAKPKEPESKTYTPQQDLPLQDNFGFGVLKVQVRLDLDKSYNERFLDSWRIKIYNIDDHGRQINPAWYGQTNNQGQADIPIPTHMLEWPLLLAAHNEAHPLYPKNTPLQKKPWQLFAMVPAYCYDKPIQINQLSDASWRYLLSGAARRGGDNWNPSNVECNLWRKNSQLLLQVDRVDDILTDLSKTPTMVLNLADLLPAIRENMQLTYKTRPPICLAERRHKGGGLSESLLILPNDPNSNSEERFIHDFSNTQFMGDNLEYFDNPELELRRSANTVTVGENGLLKTLCANTPHDQEPEPEQVLFFSSSLKVNNINLDTPDNMYNLDSKDFLGHIAEFKNSTPNNLDIKSYTIRHSNGFPLDHDKNQQVCSVTLMANFRNTQDQEQDLFPNTGFFFDNLFDEDPNNKAVVFFTSSGNQAIDIEDRWAVIINTNNISTPGDLLGLCDPKLFCTDEDLNFSTDFLDFYSVTPNFPIAKIEEALIIELLGHRKEDFRDALRIDFDPATENLFVGLRAVHELNEEQTDGEEANFTTTLTYINTHNVNKTLALCYESADYGTRKDIDVVRLKNPNIPIILASGMVARSRCFSNSRANQRWQKYSTGLWSLNGHKGVAPNLLIPAGWIGPFANYEVYLKKFDESVFRGPITVFHGQLFGGKSLEIPTITEGDEVMFFSQDSCCDDFKVKVPCLAEPIEFAPPGVPVILDTTNYADFEEKNKILKTQFSHEF